MGLKLSADLFNQIVSTLRSDRPQSKGADKRHEGRVGLRCTLEVIPGAGLNSNARSVSVWVHDISVSGIGLVTAQSVEPKSSFIARFEREGECPVSVLYEVKHCRRLASNIFSVGASFQRVLAEDSTEIKPASSKSKPQSPARSRKTVGCG